MMEIDLINYYYMRHFLLNKTFTISQIDNFSVFSWYHVFFLFHNFNIFQPTYTVQFSYI